MAKIWGILVLVGLSSLAPEGRAEGSPPTEFAPAAQSGDVWSTIGVHINSGFAFGGDTMATAIYSDGSTSSLDGGEGVYLMGGVTWTPLWPTDRFGFGLGYDVGYKLGTTGAAADGAIEFARFPMVVSLRSLFALAGNFHLLAAVGGVGEFGLHSYGTGVVTGVDTHYPDAFGGMAELGVLFGAPLSLGAELTGRLTLIEYEYQGTKFSGVNGALNATLHFFL